MRRKNLKKIPKQAVFKAYVCLILIISATALIGAWGFIISFSIMLMVMEKYADKPEAEQKPARMGR